jgi:hypothetical protein
MHHDDATTPNYCGQQDDEVGLWITEVLLSCDKNKAEACRGFVWLVAIAKQLAWVEEEQLLPALRSRTEAGHVSSINWLS